MARHVTAKGEPIDMAALIAQNSTAPALGNARMNARGDILGEKGIVLKTQEQIEAEWAAEKAKQKLLAGKPGNIKAPLENMVDPSKAKDLTADKDFEPEMGLVADKPVSVPEVKTTAGRPDVAPPTKAPTATRRKIVDAE